MRAHSFSMDEEGESLVPVSNGYIYRCRVGEWRMEDNEKRQDGSDKTLSISILKLNKVHFIIFFNLKFVDKYNVVCNGYIWLFI